MSELMSRYLPTERVETEGYLYASGKEEKRGANRHEDNWNLFALNMADLDQE
jgi:hypothetical protein